MITTRGRVVLALAWLATVVAGMTLPVWLPWTGVVL